MMLHNNLTKSTKFRPKSELLMSPNPKPQTEIKKNLEFNRRESLPSTLGEKSWLKHRKFVKSQPTIFTLNQLNIIRNPSSTHNQKNSVIQLKKFQYQSNEGSEKNFFNSILNNPKYETGSEISVSDLLKQKVQKYCLNQKLKNSPFSKLKPTSSRPIGSIVKEQQDDIKFLNSQLFKNLNHSGFSDLDFHVQSIYSRSSIYDSPLQYNFVDKQLSDEKQSIKSPSPFYSKHIKRAQSPIVLQEIPAQTKFSLKSVSSHSQKNLETAYQKKFLTKRNSSQAFYHQDQQNIQKIISGRSTQANIFNIHSTIGEDIIPKIIEIQKVDQSSSILQNLQLWDKENEEEESTYEYLKIPGQYTVRSPQKMSFKQIENIEKIDSSVQQTLLIEDIPIEIQPLPQLFVNISTPLSQEPSQNRVDFPPQLPQYLKLTLASELSRTQEITPLPQMQLKQDQQSSKSLESPEISIIIQSHSTIQIPQNTSPISSIQANFETPLFQLDEYQNKDFQSISQPQSPDLKFKSGFTNNSQKDFSSASSGQTSPVTKGILKKKNNFMNLVKIPMDHSQILKEYQKSIDSYNIIGETVVKTLDLLQALKNFWIIPLFLLFKRMYQLRIQIHKLLMEHQNIYYYQEIDDLVESQEYQNFVIKVKTENDTIFEELKKILGITIKRANLMDPKKTIKILPLLDTNIEIDFSDTCFIYIYSQVLQHIEQLSQKNSSSKPKEILLIKIQLMCSIILMESPLMKIPPDHFDLEIYQGNIIQADFKDLTHYYDIYKGVLDKLKQRLISKGIKI